MFRTSLAAALVATLGFTGVPSASAVTAQASNTIPAVTSPEAAITAALKAEDVNALPQTARLAALKRTYEARRDGVDAGGDDLDFEYLTGAQEEAGVTNVVHRARRAGATMTLTTSFRVFGDRTRTLTSRWLRGRDGQWRMDDISDGKKSLADWYRTPVE